MLPTPVRPVVHLGSEPDRTRPAPIDRLDMHASTPESVREGRGTVAVAPLLPTDENAPGPVIEPGHRMPGS
jgi:hypothetical protein